MITHDSQNGENNFTGHWHLPRTKIKPIVPPIKCQGIKTKLVNFILANVQWAGHGRWIEPFLGSGVVLFNVRPERAVANDINPHIINFYQQIVKGTITPAIVRKHLTMEGSKLQKQGQDYYYLVRERFNNDGDPLDFLFLNRASFNGLIRFNSSGKFNVPFCRKPERFSTAYVTKIANQVAAVRDVLSGKQWVFRAGDWRACLQDVRKNDFIYLAPPYIGRHADYYSQWTAADAAELAAVVQSLSCGFALSMWKENKYRANPHLTEHWHDAVLRTQNHFYHIGSTEELRNAMEEALVIKPGYESSIVEIMIAAKPEQLCMTLEKRSIYGANRDAGA